MKKIIGEDDIIELNYEDRYVAFLDILGFREIVKNNNIDKLNTYLKTIPEGIKAANDISLNEEKKEIDSILISDSIILSVKKSSNKEESLVNLLHLCIAVTMIQELLAVENIWLRGGISFGKTHFDQENHQIIGSAYISAYDLENYIAKYPRIILDNRIINELGFNDADELIVSINKKSNKHLLYPWSRGNIIEKDVPLFIDYIGFLLEHDELSPNSKHDNISQIIGHIKENIYQVNMSTYTKYKWLINYFISCFNMRGSTDLIKYFELEKL